MLGERKKEEKRVETGTGGDGGEMVAMAQILKKQTIKNSSSMSYSPSGNLVEM